MALPLTQGMVPPDLVMIPMAWCQADPAENLKPILKHIPNDVCNPTLQTSDTHIMDPKQNCLAEVI